ncbi:hypothetical protein TNCV_5136741 [Trichonephila clavipes]|nr:hypothetical protein TNCV_5136741 [Trichonephila clavipes]
MHLAKWQEEYPTFHSEVNPPPKAASCLHKFGTRRDLELEVNEDDIEELIMGHEDELTIEEHQKTQRNGSNSEQKRRKRTNADICH